MSLREISSHFLLVDPEMTIAPASTLNHENLESEALTGQSAETVK
jgi:hypothetical protein